MGPRRAGMLGEEMGEMGGRLDHRLDLPPVHAQRDWRHGASTCIRARVTTAVAMLCSTASSPLTACASAWLTASVEAAIFPPPATCCATDVSGCRIPPRAPRNTPAPPDSRATPAPAPRAPRPPGL